MPYIPPDNTENKKAPTNEDLVNIKVAKFVAAALIKKFNICITENGGDMIKFSHIQISPKIKMLTILISAVDSLGSVVIVRDFITPNTEPIDDKYSPDMNYRYFKISDPHFIDKIYDYVNEHIKD